MPTAAYSMAAADLDGDGWPGVIVARSGAPLLGDVQPPAQKIGAELIPKEVERQ